MLSRAAHEIAATLVLALRPFKHLQFDRTGWRPSKPLGVRWLARVLYLTLSLRSNESAERRFGRAKLTQLRRTG